MSEKRRDSKGRVLRNGESQRSDGKYMFRYTDGTGERHTVYSWKLVSTDKLKEGQRDSQALRDMEKRILKDLDDSIKTRGAEHTTVDDLFDQFMDIRKGLRESSRCCCNDTYRKHIKPVIGHRPIGRVKPTEIQKLYQIMVSESGVNPTTAQKAHSIFCGIRSVHACANRISTLRFCKMLWDIGTYALQWRLTQRRSEIKRLKR